MCLSINIHVHMGIRMLRNHNILEIGFPCPVRGHLVEDLRVESIIHCTHKQDVL